MSFALKDIENNAQSTADLLYLPGKSFKSLKALSIHVITTQNY
jgi:hypothetical protein